MLSLEGLKISPNLSMFVSMRANGVAIRAIRRLNKLTLVEMEERTGLSNGYLSDVERGKKGASPKTLESIATALNVKVAAISQQDA